MQDRLASGPDVALGVDPTATPEQVHKAFLQLSKRYHPAKFARLSQDLQRWANEVFLALKAAHDTLVRNNQRTTQVITGKTSRISPPNGIPVAAHKPTPPFGVTITTPGSTPSRGIPTQRPNGAPVPSRTTTPALSPRQAATPATTFPARPLRPPSVAPDPSGSGRFPVVKTPPPTPTRPGVTAAKPSFDENRVLAAAHELLRSGQWTPARQAFHALATRIPSSRHYRALLAYAKARETLADRRPEDARLELEHALQLDPELTIAKDVLAELIRK